MQVQWGNKRYTPHDHTNGMTFPTSPGRQFDISGSIFLWNIMRLCRLKDSMKNRGASQVVLVIKNPPANAGDLRDMGSIPGSGRSPGGGHGNPLQCSCLENPHGQRSLVGYSPQGHKSQTRLKQLSTHAPDKWNILLMSIIYRIIV